MFFCFVFRVFSLFVVVLKQFSFLSTAHVDSVCRVLWCKSEFFVLYLMETIGNQDVNRCEHQKFCKFKNFQKCIHNLKNYIQIIDLDEFYTEKLFDI